MIVKFLTAEDPSTFIENAHSGERGCDENTVVW